ncbi:MAG: hypothetical protein JJE25_01320, partial [Bacteroidia bacterium]|nr:hypothetical protein [Bacteroidia bacterium]
IIREWQKSGREGVPLDLLSHNPGLHDFNACFDIEIYCASRIVKFNAVGFREGGYIGLYAFETELKGFALHNNRKLI